MANAWITYVYNDTDYRRGDLSVAHKLADAANRHTNRCSLKIETIATATRLSARQVKRILHDLEGDGFVEIIRHQGRGKLPEFLLKKVTSTTPFKDRQKVTPMTPIKKKKVTLATLKGDIACKEKVTLATSPIYKEEPIKEPIINHKKVASDPSDFTTLMRHHAQRIGTVTDGGAQGKAIKTILKSFSVADALGCYDFQVAELQPEGWRSYVNWGTVLKYIPEWVKAGRPKVPAKRNGSSGSNNKQTPAEIIASRPYYQSSD